MDLRSYAACLALAMLCACSGGTGASRGAATPAAPALANSIGFPLYHGAAVVTARDFTQSVQPGDRGAGSVFDAGSGTYSGHEVIASSSASFAQLSQWVAGLAAAPPAGYQSLETANNPNEQTQAQRYGLDYATFEKTEGGKKHGLLLVVLDPQRVTARFGTILSMIGKYRALPAAWRAPFDNQAKASFGMTISQATQPDSPIGAALAALDDFQHRNARGIVLLDAVKR